VEIANYLTALVPTDNLLDFWQNNEQLGIISTSVPTREIAPVNFCCISTGGMSVLHHGFDC